MTNRSKASTILKCHTISDNNDCGGMPTSLLSIIAEVHLQEPMRRQEGWSQRDREREEVREDLERVKKRELKSWRVRERM